MTGFIAGCLGTIFLLSLLKAASKEPPIVSSKGDINEILETLEREHKHEHVEHDQNIQGRP